MSTAALGIEHLVVITPGPWTATSLDAVADAIQALREIPVARAAPEITDSNR